MLASYSRRLHLPLSRQFATVYSCGNGLNSVLGRPAQGCPFSLEPVDAFHSEELSHAAAGVTHAGICTKNGRIFTWGDSFFSQVGFHGSTSGMGFLGEGDEFPVPAVLSAISKPAVQLSMGLFHSAVLTDEGFVLTWGANSSGQLGTGSYTNNGVPEELELGDALITQLSCGGFHTLALDDGGRVYGWGRSASGQLLGVPHPVKGENPRLKVEQGTVPVPRASACGAPKAVSVAGGMYHSAIHYEDGSLHIWGAEHCGHPTETLTPWSGSPAEDAACSPRVVDTGGERVRKVVCGVGATAFLSGSGYVHIVPNRATMDTGGLTKCGDTVVLDHIGGRVVDVAMGAAHLAAVTEDGSLWTMGAGAEGQLGHGRDVPVCLTPRRVPTAVPFTRVACGWDVTFAF